MSEQLSVRDENYRLPIRVANALAGLAEKLGLPLGTVESASILRAAARHTGFSDFGPDAFQEPLDYLCEAVHNTEFTPLARVIMRQSFIRAASNRLHLQQFLKTHPEVRDRKTGRPVFVLGFPRTGTTVLQNLLQLHPKRRALQLWELVAPVPVENTEADKNKRIRAAKGMTAAANWIAPEQAQIHYIDAFTVEECWPLFANSFRVMNYDLQSGLSGYGDWLMQADMVQAYEEYRQYLQVLEFQKPADHMVLKCPEHLWFIDALLEVFPDACIVWSHRDPVPTIASYCSLISMQWRTLYGGFDPHVLGNHITNRFHQGVERAMASRQTADPKRFFDVNFHNLVQDQAGTVREICEYFDLDYGDGMDESIQHWLHNGRADHRGAHKYSTERYGINVDEVHARFADYIHTFKVDIKSA
ncbi:MAG: hypothetical protein GWP91_22655 [Rhodobacterales bacterium]|nr:hypothetical protein [Rhodobacterales bacterium]